MNEDFKKFRRKQELRAPAEFMKMAVVAMLVVSLIVFTAIGKDNAKSIVVYWAVFMSIMVIICAIQDILISRKIKKEDL